MNEDLSRQVLVLRRRYFVYLEPIGWFVEAQLEASSLAPA